MGLMLPKPEYVPFNRVRAMDLEQDLANEFSKRNWREATAQAIARWKAEGHVVQKVSCNTRRRSRYVVEE